MENRRSKSHRMGRSKPDGRCKKHPKHLQSPGVCSVCLGERLSQLSASSSRTTTTTMVTSSNSASSLSSLSSLSSHYSPSELSPVRHRYRNASAAKGSSMSFLKISGKNVLTKSRSMAFVTRLREGKLKDGKKKGGFWSKLLRPRSERIDEVPRDVFFFNFVLRKI
ncbi:hypothetical protein F0562_027729 [Nyssa sinensis]|uniref:Uncharacterized protein n=1 Tax=Nyssa sinensis TaxID=561372 RepID=A0A5J5BAA7_9ASTE|nr:hypothetical protein F0562_027729 [Nyssa sinensis]